MEKVQQSETEHKRTLLVVDDEPFLVEYVRQVAERCNYEVLTALDGDEGWTIFTRHQHKIDVVLTDIVMPSILDGFGLASNILQLNPGMDVVFMTGITPDEDLKKRSIIKKDRILRKPFNPAQLASILGKKTYAFGRG